MLAAEVRDQPLGRKKSPGMRSKKLLTVVIDGHHHIDRMWYVPGLSHEVRLKQMRLKWSKYRPPPFVHTFPKRISLSLLGFLWTI